MFQSAIIGLVAAATMLTPATVFSNSSANIPTKSQNVSVYMVDMKNIEECKELYQAILNKNGFFGNSNCVLPNLPSVPQFPSETPDVEKPSEPDFEVGDSNNNASAYAKEILNLVNAERAKAGLSPLTLSEKLSSAAQVRAKEIQSSFSHTRPNGLNFSTVLNEQGISYRASGENIAWGQASPAAVMEAWMNSSGHRANILNGNYGTLGVGYGVNASGQPYWVQLFTN